MEGNCSNNESSKDSSEVVHECILFPNGRTIVYEEKKALRNEDPKGKDKPSLVAGPRPSVNQVPEPSAAKVSSPPTEPSQVSQDQEKSPKSKIFSCRFCPKQFTSPHQLGGHQNCHKQERKLESAKKQRLHGLMPYDWSNPFYPGFPPWLDRASLGLPHLPMNNSNEFSTLSGFQRPPHFNPYSSMPCFQNTELTLGLRGQPSYVGFNNRQLSDCNRLTTMAANKGKNANANANANHTIFNLNSRGIMDGREEDLRALNVNTGFAMLNGKRGFEAGGPSSGVARNSVGLSQGESDVFNETDGTIDLLSRFSGGDGDEPKTSGYSRNEGPRDNVGAHGL